MCETLALRERTIPVAGSGYSARAQNRKLYANPARLNLIRLAEYGKPSGRPYDYPACQPCNNNLYMKGKKMENIKDYKGVSLFPDTSKSRVPYLGQ